MAIPSLGWADILGTVSAEGYTFINFDSTLAGGGSGSNANGISDTDEVVGFALGHVNMALYNYSGASTSALRRSRKPPKTENLTKKTVQLRSLTQHMNPKTVPTFAKSVLRFSASQRLR
jgi:hypothetical protein